MPDSSPSFPEELARFLERHPGVEMIDIFLADLSGVIRGKRLPVDVAAKFYSSGGALPGSVFLLHTSGDSADPKGLGFSDGDPDEIAKAIPGTLVPVPWLDRPMGQAMLTLETMDGAPYRFEPRNVLRRTLDRFSELGLSPVVAFELEFYLIDREHKDDGSPQPPVSPVTGLRDLDTQVYGMNAIDDFGNFLKDAVDACATQGIETGALSSEYAPGQFEINLQHQSDPLRAADQCVMFKRAIKGVARKHGFQATFMAKPYLEQAGSGMHIHISLVDKDGRNVFDGGSEIASPTLRHAVGGILDIMPESMAILSPNANSFRRFAANVYVPTQRSWGFENRSVALRIPVGDPKARRIEHRIAGADANPYLVLATALAGIHHGITGEIDPGPPWEGNAGADYAPELPFRPLRALDRMAESKVFADYFGADYVPTYVACKRGELDAFEAEISPAEYRWYLLPD